MSLGNELVWKRVYALVGLKSECLCLFLVMKSVIQQHYYFGMKNLGLVTMISSRAGVQLIIIIIIICFRPPSDSNIMTRDTTVTL